MPTNTDGGTQAPTLYEWAGGAAALAHLTETFYGHVRHDPLLGPLFARMASEHPQWVAQWLGEVFGGPADYTDSRGGYPHMVAQHLGRALTEEQRARWVQLMGQTADEVGLPADPEFRSAFVGYLEWGSRIALANSQPGAEPPAHLPVPRWSWGQAGLPGSAIGRASRETPAPAAAASASVELDGGAISFAADIAPLFSNRDRSSMSWAFDLADHAAVREHATAILDQVSTGRMPCYGAWPADKVDLFKGWVDGGAAP